MALSGYTLLAFGLVAWSLESGVAAQHLILLWPAAGVCAWAAVRHGWKCAPVVLVSHQAYAPADPDLLYFATNVFNAAGYVLAYVVHRRLGGTDAIFSSVREALIFVFSFAVGMSIVTGVFGSFIYMMIFNASYSDYGLLLWRWALSDFSGVVLVAPAMAALFQIRDESWVARLRALSSEGWRVMFATAVVISAIGAMTVLTPTGLGKFPTILLIMPLCIWLALDNKPRSSTISLTVTILSALYIMLHSKGTVSETAFFAAQPYAVMLMLTCLVIRASNTERNVALAALGAERAQLERTVAERTRELKALSETDVLTGLANRRSFEVSLKHVFDDAQQKGVLSFLLCLDLDRFKLVNDTSGHAAGDELLKRIAEILTQNVRDTDVVGRLGGDEFSLLLLNCPREVAMRIAEKIRMDVAELKLRWAGDVHKVGASIGIVRVDPECNDVEEVVQLGDAACYVAKNGGRNRVHMADTVDTKVETLRGTGQWASRISEAIDNDHFVLFAQEIQAANATSDEPPHMEVLIRLRDPLNGELIAPGAFLPAAERFNLMTQIDEWVVSRLIRTLEAHDPLGARHARYWVNLSGTSVGDSRFADFLIAAIDDCALARGVINFEITETAVIQKVDEACALMEQLQKRGCAFALDDFGIGQSSFSHLKLLPVDQIKVDGMFVRAVTTDAIDKIFVQSIIDIAHTMGIKAVVEFVEDDAIHAAVCEMGADYCQGFAIDRPAPLEERLANPSIDASAGGSF